ncbi:HI_0552 family protein [Moraxella sp. ZJ142]|uniref:HI_0552 family protein n=1 Tax=Moraxella marmotae TaxID=3344520 RepID=UPI0035D49047
MLTSAHAATLIKPYSQIKDLKRYCPEQLDAIKAAHKSAWQDFKAFNLAVLDKLPHDFAPPHIEKWCNGWEIRRHFFAYYKYERYLANAPIISIIVNPKRLIVSLDWHSYRQDSSSSTLPMYQNWLDAIDASQFADCYYWHSSTLMSVPDEAAFLPISQLADDMLNLDGHYRLGKFIRADELDKFTDSHGKDGDALVCWVVDTINQLAVAYETCHQD